MYFSVEEIEVALQTASTNFSFIQRFELPYLTYQNRTTHAVKIASTTEAGRIGVYFVAGIHGNEWVPPEALINFIEVVAVAYQSNNGVTIGGQTFTAAQIQSIVSNLDIFVFPLVNPDGRERSQTSPIGTDWRKNRNFSDGQGGVDINRNFDYLWDFPLYFSPDVLGDDPLMSPERPIANSKDKESSVYIGSGAASEAETKNVVHIVDANPNIRFFIDIHASGEKIFINWGNDEVQTSDVNMNFRNTDFHGQHGVQGDAYKEYVNPADNTLRISMANAMSNAIQNAHGNTYDIQVPFEGITVAGASADYMNSRSYVDANLQKVHGFGMECGSGGTQPDLIKRVEIIEEVTAGLIQFCIEATNLPSDIYIRDNLQDSGEEPLVGGGISRSPDINHFRQELLNPQDFLGTPIAKHQGDLFETVEIGQTNYIYVRLQNRGYRVDDAEIDIYWMLPSTLPSPASWNLIGTIVTENILPGSFKIAGPLEWNSIPDKGHYCFVAVIGTPTDPKPDINSITTIDDFYNLVRQNSNITWKNFDVDDMFAGGMATMSFQIQGWSRLALNSDLDVDLSELPEGTEAELKILKRITENAVLENLSIKKVSKLYNYYLVTPSMVSKISGLKLNSSENVKAVLTITLPENIADGVYDVAFIQSFNGKEMGRVTRRLNVGKFPFVANRNSKEVHRKNCPWIPKMNSLNKIPYGELELAIKHGYDGCHTCLTEFDHG
ncbi:M14 family zinc carboxypeptidase [Flavivirga abyssicola]|uniref:M14 family zinc carboxypeptidase n=1 Tax=Flavivirga abyssicola TaxID=3063533 RepID=UPI0026DF1012|nr:M14 family zinc carboxypeptidase [Flavivirga sp. MEBiC07777]WVK12810.1 M14 family zinc carboxypeptidase [Flavivirga sp. MEBiC07777]